MSSPKRRWYQHNWLIILVCVLFFPLGIVLIWKSTWSKRVKTFATTVVSVAMVGVVALSVIFAPPTATVTSSLQAISTSTYALQGTVSSANEVMVNGVAATIDGDSFHAQVPLHEGDNDITVVATTGNKQTTTHYTVHRYTKAEIAQQKADAAKKKAAAALAAKNKAAAIAAAKQKAAAQKAAADKKAQDDAAAAAKKKSDAAAAAAQKQAAADAATAAQKAAAIAAAQPKVVLDVSGSGIKQTQAFTTKSSWAIAYTFDCSNFGYQGNFQIYMNNTDGSYNSDAGPNDLAMSGSNTDYYYNDPGEHYMTINSECDWHVVAKS